MSYSISIIGTGYVGLVTGTCFAETGNKVICIDIDENKLNKLKSGICPIYEPGLEYMLKQNIKDKRLSFSDMLADAVRASSLIFLCLPTPPNEDGSADLHHVMDCARDIANIIKEYKIIDKKIVLNKSTVPVGTAEKVRSIFKSIAPEAPVEVASNPEFLREGFAVEDSLKPERVVVGTSSKYVEDTLRDLYEPFLRSGNPIYFMDEKSAEITKYAANAFLATKISFMNDLSSYCEKVGADIEKVRIGIGSDSRIGKRFLFAGIGFGGACFPKDVRALMYSAEEAGFPLDIVPAAYHVNAKQANRFFDKILNRFGGSLSGKRIALWGLSFKPNTDDTREAPSFQLIERFLDSGAIISVYDQEAVENTKNKFGDAIEYAATMYDCLEGAEALVIATEWNMFRNPDFTRVKESLANPLIFDGRNLYSLSEMRNLGFEYHCIGRKPVVPDVCCE